ncbi:MAG: flavodoxin family protein [Desulfovibrionaceae bacterium]|nr:flavodoxin family protein [Desulfovibrionaceae bacterium]MBR5734484.1 flavodoxin family protein [Desulfovibrionaceae bacterium]
MNVLLLNGSPHKDGCTFTALSEIAATLKKHGIDSTLVQLGTQPVPGCIACQKCRTGHQGCIFDDAPYQRCLELLDSIDGLVVGSPVYYAGPNGSLCALLDRLFYSSSAKLAGKPAAAVVSCRRGGASASFDRLNKYFTINSMPVVASQYWNSVHGNTPEEVRQDIEGLQTMRTLAANMAWMLKSIKANPEPRPQQEAWTPTNFIR